MGSIILLLISCISFSLSSYAQFDRLKKDSSLNLVKSVTKSPKGIVEIKGQEALFKTQDVKLYHRSANGYKLEFSWWSLKNEEQQMVINFNGTDIKDLINLLDLIETRNGDCEFKSKTFHIGRLGQRLIFFHNGGYANISDIEGKQLDDFLKTIKP